MSGASLAAAPDVSVPRKVITLGRYHLAMGNNAQTEVKWMTFDEWWKRFFTNRSISRQEAAREAWDFAGGLIPPGEPYPEMVTFQNGVRVELYYQEGGDRTPYLNVVQLLRIPEEGKYTKRVIRSHRGAWAVYDPDKVMVERFDTEDEADDFLQKLNKAFERGQNAKQQTST